MADTPENNNGKALAQADHDLLIRLDTKMDRTIVDVKELHSHISTVHRSVEGLSATVDAKIAAAVANKIDKDEAERILTDAQKVHDDHEKRIRRLEMYTWTAIGALAIIQALVAFLK